MKRKGYRKTKAKPKEKPFFTWQRVLMVTLSLTVFQWGASREGLTAWVVLLLSVFD